MIVANSTTSLQLPTLNTEHSPRAHAATVSSETEAANDHTLMLAVRNGDIDRLGELFERHHRRLYAFCVHLTSQSAAAEDIVQNVFHRILKYRHTYRDDGSFTTWMYHLARNSAADYFRKQSTVPLSADPADLHAHPSPDPAPDIRAAQTDDLALLRTALAKLAPEDREILVLTRIEKLEHKEAARILECSVGAAKVRAHRALKTLRETYLTLRNFTYTAAP